ncbi:MAG: 3-methyl-2-oxobutanoate dehydrogenase subunit VorB [candidate division KSB1 bacterium]|nr:3-methyl-2-oxobutanoate dehydrogenase subunit VorB [candidate division KSB1 bacterium]MDZ7368334.1 3-methyl-2-oxobutanoate dehydrogenase subunit VorB [candidate division KSB1 bacterium]MDZ7403054.1 3-methyl-2-oxobutanoate dehydrogenase subunit VorB [candidate division KSB1 bacterium]
MNQQLIKGNEAVVKAALLAGCRAYFGYPITPASEIAESAAEYFPKIGGIFLQAESEVASINMLYGAASAGMRAMTASSSPGISLMQEGLSYMAGAELPGVVVDIMRGGPGLGNIAPEQADYFQIVKGGGHGNYRVIALAPNSAQEMCDLTILAFDLADKYRNPAIVLADGFIGQMMEPVNFPEPVSRLPQKKWAVMGTPETRDNLISSIELVPEALEAHVHHLQAKYETIAKNEVRYEGYRLDDAEIVTIGYGIVARLLRTAVDMARARDIPVGLLRPVTLWPFPSQKIGELADQAYGFLVCELSTGQMVEDVRLAVRDWVPVEFYGRAGGVVPSSEELFQQIVEFWNKVDGMDV